VTSDGMRTHRPHGGRSLALSSQLRATQGE